MATEKSKRKVELLVAKRDSYFAYLQSIYDCIPDSDSDDKIIDNFLTKSQSISDNFRSEFVQIVDDLNNSLDVSQKPNFECVWSFTDLYNCIIKSRERFSKKQSSASGSKSTIDSELRSNVKLPRIELKQFNGDLNDWPLFIETFNMLIHENNTLNDTERIQYLLSSLSGKARSICTGITPASKNYLPLYNSLIDKYQDDRALASNYIDQILDFKPISNLNSNNLESFIDKFTTTYTALEQLNIDNFKEFIFVHIGLKKLDSETVKSFETAYRKPGQLPTYKEFVTFIREQVKVLERTSKSELKPKTYQNKNSAKISRSYISTQVSKNNCAFCNKNDHIHLYECSDFKNIVPQKRFNFIKQKQGCINCLSLSHTSAKCKSNRTCTRCQKRHHSLLHFNTNLNLKTSNTLSDMNNVDAQAQQVTPSAHAPSVALAMHTYACSSLDNESSGLPRSNALLSTAQVYAYKNNTQNKLLVRCLIDNASQNHIMTMSCCKKLNLNISPLNNSFIKGVGSSSRPIYGYTNLTIESRVTPHKYNINVLVVDRITDDLPTRYIEASHMYFIKNIPLADNDWNVPAQIDILLGSQLFPFILLNGRVEAPPPAPPLLETTFGYILMGDVSCVLSEDTDIVSTACLSLTDSELNNSLHKFWELEELPSQSFSSPEDIACEEIYSSTVTRNSDGRYIVSLPFKDSESSLGNSRATAHRRFLSLERKFKVSPALRDNYNEIIREYINNKYLCEVPLQLDSDEGYFIPHHAVLRTDKATTKVRIVLDASAKTHTGLSLNDILHAGPNLQADLFKLLLSFRLFPIAITADIKQMYLQIGVINDHCKFQKILYRFNTNEDIRVFKFLRVPFGLKSSPFLAMRTIRQLASDEKYRYPAAAAVAESSLYTDDLVSSVATADEAIDIAKQLITMFSSGGFNLVKWASNSAELLSTLPPSHCAPVDFTDEAGMKILGLAWHPAEDNFYFNVNKCTTTCTKRTILSTVARLFDVLGLVSPVILFAKLLIKELWNANIDWDDTPPDHITTSFFKLLEELTFLSNLRIPRHLNVSNNCKVNIVAFCDASMKAYGCVIYLHVTDPSGNIFVELACSKSKVSPVKVVSLARLELCAALLLSKLVRCIYDCYNTRYPISNIYAFSDSTIALSWIHSSPHRWSIFVSNRIAKIHENLDAKHFYHISGMENPGDCVSRGMLPSDLMVDKLWWRGPTWLRSPTDLWPITPFITNSDSNIPEKKLHTFVTVTCNDDLPLIYKVSKNISSWNKVLNIITYILRFAKILPRSDKITLSDINTAEHYLIQAVQKVHFADIIKMLKNGSVPSNLKHLSLFIDDKGLIRIGGRLSNSNLPFEAQHPLLLPKKDHIVNLLIDHYHIRNCHTGASLLSSLIKQNYWILSSRNTIRQRVKLCNICFRANPTHSWPKMADLPSYRVQQAKAFVHTGLDYAGPIHITLTRRRGQKSQKAYLCIFVCLTTKAVHIELASDLSTDTFLDAFKRFLSRRGPVSVIYSDNGTNFIGARAKLNEIYSLTASSDFQNCISNELNQRKIIWNTIPPSSPHFGGIWEANVKSFKRHFYKVIGTQLLSYEETLTILTQIECILNSRPLCVLSEDPYPEVLTPAHFLMSTPLQFLPAVDVSSERLSLLNRKQLLDNLVQHFWKKWSLEYLHTMQSRLKWSSSSSSLKVGTIVLIIQDDVSPLRWPLGIIKEVYPGRDGIVRVALVKTQNSTFKRPVVKLCPLPSQ